MIHVAVGVPAPPMRITSAAPCSIHSKAAGPRSLASGSGRNEACDTSMSQPPARNRSPSRAGLMVIASPSGGPGRAVAATGAFRLVVIPVVLLLVVGRDGLA